MAYRKKAGYLLTHKPDIAIISECEHPDKLKFMDGVRLPKNIFWAGDIPTKASAFFLTVIINFNCTKAIIRLLKILFRCM